MRDDSGPTWTTASQPETEYSHDLKGMKRFCRLGSREIRMRLIILGVLSAMMVFWQDDLRYAWLYLVYFVLNFLAILVIAKAPEKATRKQFWFYSFVVNMPLFSVLNCCLLLWSADDPFLNMLGALLVFACLFNMLTVRAVEPVLVNWDTVALAVTMCAMLVIDLQRYGFSPRVLILTAAFAAAIVYFMNCAIAIVRFRSALNEAQLQEVQRSKVEAIGRLTGGVAHDFNNLLTVILGNIELARMPGPQRDREMVLIEAQEAGQRAARLTAQLLGFSRQSVLRPREVDITEVVSAATALLKRLLPESIRVFVRPFPPGLPMVVLDPDKLEVVLMNLAINGRDAMPEQGRLRIGVDEQSLKQPLRTETANLPVGVYVVVTVEDNGEGSPPALLSRVTEPFFTTKELGEGSGLGLSMARGFAEQSGGGLDISSIQGRGTSVRLFLPASRKAPKTDDKKAARIL